MYLKTRRPTSRRRGISLRRLLVWLFAPILIVIAAGAFYMRDDLRRIIAPFFERAIEDAQNTVATITAPTPLPTADPSSNQRLADAAWQNGQYQEAVRLYESILPAVPNTVQVHYYYTLGLIMQGRLQEALVAAENTVTANPFSSDAWAIRALALNRSERYADSVVSALRAIELNPESARAHAYLAESYADLGRFTRAQQEIERALELNPDSFEAHYVRGLYERDVNYNYIAAREEFEEAYDLSNGAAHVGLNLGRLLMQNLGSDPANVTAAQALLNDILDRNPDNAPILYELGSYMWRQQGDTERGESYLRRCVAAVPSYIPCQYELGRVLNALGMTDEARQAFERTIALGSTNPYHYYWAGSSQITATGDCGAAMRYLQPGYQIVQDEIALGFTIYAFDISAIEALRGDYQQLMSPCMGGQAFPTDVPESTPEVEQ